MILIGGGPLGWGEPLFPVGGFVVCLAFHLPLVFSACRLGGSEATGVEQPENDFRDDVIFELLHEPVQRSVESVDVL